MRSSTFRLQGNTLKRELRTLQNERGGSIRGPNPFASVLIGLESEREANPDGSETDRLPVPKSCPPKRLQADKEGEASLSSPPSHLRSPIMFDYTSYCHYLASVDHLLSANSINIDLPPGGVKRFVPSHRNLSLPRQRSNIGEAVSNRGWPNGRFRVTLKETGGSSWK